uniref:Uncharacterized protein n=1 Tax=Glossina pallidipes TaxID=7398 RepID=A0A1B0AF03_GLOPL
MYKNKLIISQTMSQFIFIDSDEFLRSVPRSGWLLYFTLDRLSYYQRFYICKFNFMRLLLNFIHLHDLRLNGEQTYVYQRYAHFAIWIGMIKLIIHALSILCKKYGFLVTHSGYSRVQNGGELNRFEFYKF